MRLQLRQCCQFLRQQRAPPICTNPARFLSVSIKHALLSLRHSQPERCRSTAQHLHPLLVQANYCSHECRYLCVCSPGCSVQQIPESALTYCVTESRGRGSPLRQPASSPHAAGPLGSSAPLRAARQLHHAPGGRRRSEQPEPATGQTHLQERLSLPDQILPEQQSQRPGPQPQDKGQRLPRLDGLWATQRRGVRVLLLKARLGLFFFRHEKKNTE